MEKVDFSLENSNSLSIKNISKFYSLCIKKMFAEVIKNNQEWLKNLELKPRAYQRYADWWKLNKIISFV